MDNDCYGVELHMHLDGCVPAKVVWNAAKRKNKLLELKEVSKANHMNELWDFISVDDSCATLKAVLDGMRGYFPFIVDDETALRELCHYVVRHQFKNKIYYTETRYCPHLLCESVLTPSKVVEIISDELNTRSKEYGIVTKQILCCMRMWLNTAEEENANKTLDELLVKPREIIEIAAKYRDLGMGIVGVDLAGNESDSSSKDGYNTIFNEAKNKYNLHITIHAGEGNDISYSNIYDAIENMNAERIGHGYKTVDSPKLIEDLSMSSLDKPNQSGKYSHIHVECCPTSSIITNSVNGIPLRSKDYKQHPIKQFNDQNINYSVSTDDPQVLRCSYQGQLSILADRMDIPVSDIKESIIRAAKHSFLDGNDKKELVKEIEKRVDKHFRIYKPKHYHNDSHRFIDVNADSSDELINFNTKYDSQRKTMLKYLTFSMIAGFGSAVLYQSRKK